MSFVSPSPVIPACHWRAAPPTSASASPPCKTPIREAAEAAPAATSAEVPSEALEARELRRRVKLLEQENEVLRRAAAYFAQVHLPGK